MFRSLLVVLGCSSLVALGAGAVTGGHEPPPTLVYPVDLAADGESLVVADFKAHGLLRFAAGQITPIRQGPGLPRTPLYGTRAVAPAPDGNGWLVADPATFGLYRIGADGDLSTITTELDQPQGLVAFDAQSVLVSDLRSGIGAVLRVTLDGRVTVFAEVGSPKGIVADGDGFALVSHGERALYRLSRDGALTTVAQGPPFDFPHDLVRDDEGWVVTDGYASALFRVTPTGQVSVIAQGAPLVNPQGIVASPDGGWLVADPQARALFRVRPDGSVASVFAVVAD